jgi:hypothetical protein
MFSKTKVTAERRSTSTLCLDVAKHIAIAFSIVDKATTVSRGRDDVEMLIVACLPRRCRAIDAGHRHCVLTSPNTLPLHSASLTRLLL